MLRLHQRMWHCFASVGCVCIWEWGGGGRWRWWLWLFFLFFFPHACVSTMAERSGELLPGTRQETQAPPLLKLQISECVCSAVGPPKVTPHKGAEKALPSLLFIQSTMEPHSGFLAVSLSVPPSSPQQGKLERRGHPVLQAWQQLPSVTETLPPSIIHPSRVREKNENCRRQLKVCFPSKGQKYSKTFFKMWV